MSGLDPEQERREFQRLYLNLPVWYKVLNPENVRKELDSTDLEAITLDISPFGLAFKSNHEIPVSSDLNLKFTVSGKQKTPNLTIPVEVNARVCSCVPDENNQYRASVAFKDMDPEIQKKLSSFIEESLKFLV